MTTDVASESQRFRERFQLVRDEIGKVIVGNDAIVEGVLSGLLARGHVLLEGIPGLGKTRLVQTLADVLHLRFSRIQFTPDLMPADIIGTNVVQESEAGDKVLVFQPGPIFANIVLADEINRATPKTQSALLQAMQEQRVSVAGQYHPVPTPFHVLATQNPIEMEGTYTLPEAQLDRFFFKLLVDYPSGDGLAQILERTTQRAIPHGEKVMDAGQIQHWQGLVRDVPAAPQVTKFRDIGRQPYDGLITPDGRYYMAGLFGEDGIALLDLWHPEKGVRRILDGYGRGEEPLPVYKMPHLEGWASAGNLLVLPEVGHHELLLVERETWREVGRIAVHGQPVFAIARPDGRQVWVNFAHPLNDVVQVIDLPSQKVIETLHPGKAVLHMEFTPRGEQVWISLRDEDRVEVYDPDTRKRIAALPVDKPSGIFLTARANRIGL